MVAPLHDINYDNRKGYDSGFLGVKDVPLPRATKPDELATLSDGSHVIPYHHFSIVLDKRRRLPVYTACNVDYSPTKKEPEPGDYTRKGLSGLGPNDMELWFTDPRLPSEASAVRQVLHKGQGCLRPRPRRSARRRRMGLELSRGARLRRRHLPHHELHSTGGRLQPARQGVELGRPRTIRSQTSSSRPSFVVRGSRPADR